MSRLAILPLLIALTLPACGDDRAVDGDAMVPDMGVTPDSGPVPDAKPAPDANPAPDAKPAPDAGSGPCTGPTPATWKYKTGEATFGRNNYIEFIPGDMPVVVSSPHGGYLKPAEIKDRTYGVLGSDSNSQEYTREVAHYLLKLTGRRPHVIINRLYRKKLDANREIKEACQGDKWSEQAWAEYHKYINDARAWVTSRCGKGHYLDFHTNAHAAKWVELGQMLSATDLNRGDSALNDVAFVNKSSLRALAKLPGRALADIVRGPKSLGALLMSRGYKAVPSPKYPHPAGQGFFYGGYNTYTHGSRTSGTIDGTQVETYWDMINSLSERDDYSFKLALSIRDFVEHHYKWTLKDPRWAPPAHQSCVSAKALPLVAGQATAKGTTAGASNEFGQQITCGGADKWDGPQVYYAVKLQPGSTYEISLTPSFAARIYLFGDTCNSSMINVQCKASGMDGELVYPTVTGKFTVKAGPYTTHTIAIDANSKPYYGAFTLTVKKK